MSKRSIIVLVFAAACGGAETPAQQPQPASQPEAQPASATADETHMACVESFQRQRDCTNEFIPALVAARVRLNVPPGIADKDKELGRDKLVEMALEEWKTDSTDQAIGETCTNLAAKLPPEAKAQVVEQVRQCLAADACTAYVDCIVPVIESQLH